MATHGTCCDQQHALESLAEELQDAAADPTLASCCQRDLEEQAAAAKLRACLTAADRSNLRQQVAQGVLRSRTLPERSLEVEEEELDSGSGSDDAALARFRALRLGEMQRQRAERVRLQAAGHGTVTDVPSSRLLEVVTASEAPLVCHLAAEGCEACNELDEHLAVLAHRHPATRFIRSLIRRGSSHLGQALGLPGSQPGLACFREGALVGSADLDAFMEGGGLREDQVTAWLRGQHMLQQRLQQRRGESGQGPPSTLDEPPSSDEEQADEDDSWQPACEVCGRRYPHQHIRSAYVTRPEDSSDDDEA